MKPEQIERHLAVMSPPVRTDRVTFTDGSTSDYKPPVSTLDPRWAACTEHRVGCDCREAGLREDIADARLEIKELRAENQRLRDLIASVAVMTSAVEQ